MKIIKLLPILFFVIASCTTTSETTDKTSSKYPNLDYQVVFVIGQRPILQPILDKLRKSAPLTIFENVDNYVPQASAYYLVINTDRFPNDKIFSLPNLGLNDSTSNISIITDSLNKVLYIKEKDDHIIVGSMIPNILSSLNDIASGFPIDAMERRNPPDKAPSDSWEAYISKRFESFKPSIEESMDYNVATIQISKTENKVVKQPTHKNDVVVTKTDKLDGQTILVLTHIEDMVEILNVLERDYPTINWVPTEVAHKTFELKPNGRYMYGNYLILETKGKLTDMHPDFYGDNKNIIDGKIRNGVSDIGLLTQYYYFQDDTPSKIIRRLPAIIDNLNTNYSPFELIELPYKITYPDKKKPFLNINNDKMSLINRVTGDITDLFSISSTGTYNDETQNYTWEFIASNIPKEIESLFITVLHHEKRSKEMGYYHKFIMDNIDGEISITDSFKASYDPIAGTIIEAIQILYTDNTVLSYPYDLLPRFPNHNPEYYKEYSPNVYWIKQDE